MNKNTLLWAALSLTLNLSHAHSEQFLIDPSKAGTFRCEDAQFKNDTYTEEGPQQHFVFTGTDGLAHSMDFENHAECRAKLQFVKTAQLDINHPWVQVETSSNYFGLTSTPGAQEQAKTFDHLSEQVAFLQKQVNDLKSAHHYTQSKHHSDREISSEHPTQKGD